MDRRRDVPALYPPPHLEPEMAGKHWEGAVHAIPHSSDGACCTGPDLHPGVHDKRDHSFPPRLHFPGDQRTEQPGKSHPYDLRLLGLRADVPASWDPLGDDDRHGGHGALRVCRALCEQSFDESRQEKE